MKRRTIGTLAAAALLAALAVLWWLQRDRPAVAPSGPLLPGLGDASAAAAQESRAAESEAVRAPVPSRPESGPSRPGPLAVIRGRCIAGDNGLPLPGCVVRLHGSTRTTADRAIHALVTWKDPEPQTTVRDGTFELRFDPPPSHCYSLDIQAEKRVTRTASWLRLEPEHVEDLGDVPLALGHEVSGHVVDESGNPVPEAWVSIDRLPLPLRGDMGANDTRGGASAKDGRFHIVGAIPDGRWSLDVSARGRKLVRPDSVRVDGGAVELTVVVRSMPSISGAVIDDAGNPVPKISLVARQGLAGKMASSSTRQDGTFEIFAVDDDVAPVAIQVSSRGPYEPPSDSRVHAWGTKDIRIVLWRALAFELTVVESVTQRPVEEFSVRCHARAVPDSGPMDLRLGGRHPGGRVMVDRVWRGKNVLRVFPKDPALLPTRTLEFEARDEGASPMRVEVLRMPPLNVRVVTKGGTPVAGTRVELVDSNGQSVTARESVIDERRTISFGPIGSPLLVTAANTDENGRATVFGPPGVPGLALRVLGPGHEPLVREGIHVGEGTELVIVVPDGATLKGKLTPAGVMSLEPGLRLRRPGEERPSIPAPDDDHIRVSKDGTFEVSGLPEGEWEVLFDASIRFRKEGGGSYGTVSMMPPLAKVRLVGSEVTRVELDASRFVAGRLEGRVLLGGAPPVSARVSLRGRQPSSSWWADWHVGEFIPDADGRFVAELPPGTYRLRLRVGDVKTREGNFIAARDEFVVAAGERTERVFHLERLRLRLHLLESDGVTPIKTTECLVSATPEFSSNGTTDEQGLLVIDPAPPGRVHVRLRRREGTFDPVEVPAGQTEASFDLVLGGVKGK